MSSRPSLDVHDHVRAHVSAVTRNVPRDDQPPAPTNRSPGLLQKSATASATASGSAAGPGLASVSARRRSMVSPDVTAIAPPTIAVPPAADSNRPAPLDTTNQAHPHAPPPPPPSPGRRHLVFADPIAFRYLEEDPCVSVVQRQQRLAGYELYLVEQWACSRQSPTLVIVTYTGDEAHAVSVGILSIPSDPAACSPKVRVYLQAIRQHHARPRDTPLGELMVTNLSSFPSALTVISVPDGDIRRHRHHFIVNEDLKRLGCSGRSGMTLADPAPAARTMFLQTYRVSEKIPFTEAVQELVRMCQIALALFNKLDLLFADGLLCDVTESALADWWTEFGAEYYNVEPSDGILGPTTVVALLGLLVGARNRLAYFGAPVTKDPFDLYATERGIHHFQKYHKMDRTRRLDRQTMHKLHAVTAKAAAGDVWGVQKAVKSTVREIGGNRGELVLGMVAGRDKGGIADIETLDLDRFIDLATGEHSKWLWHGKPRRSAPEERPVSERTNMLFGRDDLASVEAQQHQHQHQLKRPPTNHDEDQDVYSAPFQGSALSVAENPADKDALRRGVFKNVARDARSGFGRIKDAVYSGSAPRGHAPKPSRDESGDYPAPLQTSFSPTGPAQTLSPPSAPIGRAFTWKNKPEEYMPSMKRDGNDSAAPTTYDTQGLTDDMSSDYSRSAPGQVARSRKVTASDPTGLLEHSKDATTAEPSGPESSVYASDADKKIPAAARGQGGSLGAMTLLKRRHSIIGKGPSDQIPLDEHRWPHRLSFGDAEEAVLRWEELAPLSPESDLSTPADVNGQARLAEIARSLYSSVSDIEHGLGPWVGEKLAALEALDAQYGRQREELQAAYLGTAETAQRGRHDAEEAVGEARSRLGESVREVELGAQKLDYELEALLSRVQDVEAGVADFGARVTEMEARADDLKTQLETESWIHWAVRSVTGIGRGPNLTRPPRG